jgi:uncharacterized protein (DUF58 family)
MDASIAPKPTATNSETALKNESRFFQPQLLSGLERMRFTTSRRVEGSYSGRHLAKRLGGSGEFVDYREYTPGDDLRRLDWRVMGRTGRAYLKLYQDETDLNCTMLLDASGSMMQGARSPRNFEGSKLEWMQYFTTALSHLILLGRDSVGIAVMQDKLASYLPATSAIQQRGLLHQRIASLTPIGESRLDDGLDELLLRVRRRGVLMIISDFLVPSVDKLVSSIRKFRSRGWETVALHVIHPDEENLPDGLSFRFIGLENDGSINCQIPQLRQEYKQRFAAHASTIRGALVSQGCDYHRISVAVNYLEVLRSFLVARV